MSKKLSLNYVIDVGHVPDEAHRQELVEHTMMSMARSLAEQIVRQRSLFKRTNHGPYVHLSLELELPE